MMSANEYFESYKEFGEALVIEELSIDAKEVCNGILDGECEGCFYNRELDDVVEEYYDNAKALFEMAMKNNPDETIALLWNMNN